MSRKNQNQNKPTKKEIQKDEEVIHAPLELNEDTVVTMVFSEHKYYNDLTIPLFDKDVEYKLKGIGWINRWLRRGGKIVGPGAELNPDSPVVEVEPKVEQVQVNDEAFAAEEDLESKVETSEDKAE